MPRLTCWSFQSGECAAELDPARDFEFLAKGLFLEGSLQEYVEAQRAAGAPVEEQGVVLEFTEAMPEPEQGPVCAHPDWVSALDGSLEMIGLSQVATMEWFGYSQVRI